MCNVNKELKKLAKEAERYAKKICTCGENCYAKDIPPLVFPPLDTQRVIFISEAPYNFPRKCIKNSGDFITKELPVELSYYIFKCPMPYTEGNWNIFRFIYEAFHPLFENCTCGEEATLKFLKHVYWTHMAKKSLKGISKNGAISKCLEKFSQEFNCIYEKRGSGIKLFIVCTSYFYNKFTKYPKWKRIIVQQFKILKTKDRLLKINDILVPSKPNRKVNSSIRECIEVLKQFEDCHIAFFPNPSKANIKRIREFFTEKHVNKLLNKIYGILQSIQ